MATKNNVAGSFFSKKIPVYYVLIISLLALAIIYWKFSSVSASGTADTSYSPKNCVDKMAVQRSHDYKLIRPLFFSDIANESDQYAILKKNVSDLVEQKITTGTLADFGLYFRNMNDGSWFSYNVNQGFHPGSLTKIPILITYLKMAELNPSLLNKEIIFDKKPAYLPEQTFNEPTIEIGKKYTIRDLLFHMIVYSDNSATTLLTNNINADIFIKLFSDIGIPGPPLADANYQISAYEMSKFLRILYNSTFLNANSSEYGMSLLTQARFHEGILAGLPANITVAHKFGEAGPKELRELHETAIVFLEKTPYLITVMTKGKDIQSQAALIKQISEMTYQSMAQVN
jgi:beta-lactamase class A